MKKENRDIKNLSPHRRALYDAIKNKGVSEAHLSRLVRGNDYFINKYLWANNPQRLPLDEGIALAKELNIAPEKILGDRAEMLTALKETAVIEEDKGVGNETRAENKKMNVYYELAVEALSKLSPEEMVNAVSAAMDLSAQEKVNRNPRSREITS